MSNQNIRKKEAFTAFIKLIEGNAVAYWSHIATAIGVNKDTINEWKKHPLAKKAIMDGINRALTNMETAGKNDWRMWESKLKMLGISPLNKNDVTSGGGPLTVIERIYPPSLNDIK